MAMRKFFSFFTRDWLLKLISLVLATVLYLSLKDEPSKAHNGNVKQKPRTESIHLSYEAMTNTILKALNSAKAKSENTSKISENITNEHKKVSGSKNAK